MPETREIWRPIPDWEGLYEASSEGRIKSLPRIVRRRNRWGGDSICSYGARILAPTDNGTGYSIVQLSDEFGRHTLSVHALVCAAFHGRRPDGKQAAHGDGNASNNRPENLRWATPIENAADKAIHGRENCGERNWSARLGQSDVVTIRKMADAGMCRNHLSEQFGVTKNHINSICAYRTWKHVA